MAKHEHETVRTGMTQFENKGAHPSGKVCTDASEVSTVALPKRSSEGLLPETVLDENADLPKTSNKGKKG
jgi:hypothetical protein